MPLEIIRGDITAIKADAIVNAANNSLMPGGGVCGAIFDTAGYRQLEQACRIIGYCEVGHAVLTDAFALPAKYIIHTVGPIWQGGGQNEALLLRNCYMNSLWTAEKNGCQSIAFPLISTGVFGYPKAEAMQIAVSTIRTFLLEHEMHVLLVVFDRSTAMFSQKLMDSIQMYIDDHYVDSHTFHRSELEHQYQTRQLREQRPIGLAMQPMAAAMPALDTEKKRRSLKDLVDHLDESFSKMLLRLVDEKGMTDVEVYKRANIDRKLFSKIRREGYNPSKQTAIALAIALRLNLDETKELLGKAGYALSRSNKFDVVIEYFIVEKIYDIYEINEALFAFEQRLLGA